MTSLKERSPIGIDARGRKGVRRSLTMSAKATAASEHIEQGHSLTVAALRESNGLCFFEASREQQEMFEIELRCREERMHALIDLRAQARKG